MTHDEVIGSLVVVTKKDDQVSLSGSIGPSVREQTLFEAGEQLSKALNLATARPRPHNGNWHRKGHVVGDDCVGCAIENALAYWEKLKK